MVRRREKGQSVAELALLLPLLMLLLLGCLDLGRAYRVWIALASGTREGARYACLHPDAVSDIEDVTKTDILAEGLLESRIAVSLSTPEAAKTGHPIIVTASYSLPMVTGFLFGGRPITIRASTQMVIIEGIS